MAEQTITTGIDIHVTSASPTFVGDRTYLVIGPAATRPMFLLMPLSIPSGRVVLSAILTGTSLNVWPGGTVDVRAISEPWTPSKTSFNTRPDVSGPVESTVVPDITAADQEFELDITDLVQAIADGQPNYGWQLTSEAANILLPRAFNAGGQPWTLTVETSDLPVEPATLTPQGKVSLAKWVCRVEDFESLGAMQVRVDADKVAPFDFESAEVATAIPQLDLAATAYAGLADGAATCWQARVKTTDGFWSPWSDWVEVTRSTKPTMTVTVPAAGVPLTDPTPTVTASLAPAGDADTRWRVQVARVSAPTEILYDSGDALTGTTLAHTVPLRWNGETVISGDGDYRFIIDAWDSAERVPSMGDPTYVRVVRDVALDADALVNPPQTLRAAQAENGHPGVVLRWTREGAAPDRFVILRNGSNLEVLDAADVAVGPNTWQWVDDTATPYRQSRYGIKAIEDGKQSIVGPRAWITPKPIGVWILSEHGDVVLKGTGVENFKQTDKRTTFELPFSNEAVDMITAVAGYSCDSADFEIDDHDAGQDLQTALAVLKTIRSRSYEPVRLVWATGSVRAYLQGLSVTPHPETLPGHGWERHIVSFGFRQTFKGA